jgi:hypothetical protein
MAAMKLITDTKLKKALSNCSDGELIELISELSTKFTLVKEFLTLRYGETLMDSELCAKYKAIIANEFFPAHGLGKMRLKVVKTAISDFKKVSGSREQYIDILLFYVEQCVMFTAEYGDINEQFYNSATRVYEQAAQEVNKSNEQLYLKFANRFSNIVRDACEGWGFQDELRAIYCSIDFTNED